MQHNKGSLKYQTKLAFKRQCALPAQKRGRRTPITPQSKKQYWRYVEKFVQWCKKEHHCRNFEDCEAHIQDYAEALQKRGLSASTIHTYLAGVCRTWGVKMDKIAKPVRCTAENTRSRGTKAVDQRSDAKREASPQLHDFAERVGIRRAEYGALHGDDLVLDESNHLCVRVQRGKGGKFQLQRILPGDEALVRSYFDGNPAHSVFAKEEMKNKIDLHHLRAKQAQRAYYYYLEKIKKDPSYREQLTNEIKARWDKYCKKRWKDKEVTGCRYIRGKNRELAERLGLPVCYDRLCLMAVSVLHLSHWRLDVTVSNYMLHL